MRKIHLVALLSTIMLLNCRAVDSDLSAPELPRSQAFYGKQWEQWKNSYKKEYGSKEEEWEKYSVWLDNMHYVEEHNKNTKNHGFNLRMNSLGDISAKEWTDQGLSSCHRFDTPYRSDAEGLYRPAAGEYLAESVDWRKLNVVTEVKNQEDYRCHSCYAFAATGAIESAVAIKTGKRTCLSEQQIVDCSRLYANAACYGGNYKFSWWYILDVGGLNTASSYPYKSLEGYCNFTRENIAATLKGMEYIQKGSEEDLQSAVAMKGPVVVAIDHKHRSFQFYSDGVYNEYSCSMNSSSLSHEMLVVGYGVNTYNLPYWIVKNSYGSDWGDDGYMLMRRNVNQCGVAMDAGFPIV